MYRLLLRIIPHLDPVFQIKGIFPSHFSLSKFHEFKLENVKYVTTEATWDNPDYVDNVMYDELKLYLESKGFVEKQIINHSENWGDVLFVKLIEE